MLDSAPSLAQGGLTASFRYAIDGVLRTLCTQRNMKIHWVSGTAAMLVGMALELDVAARAAILFCVFMVLCMEVLNTALEAFVDLHVKTYVRHAMIAKDAAAAAVLVLAVCAVFVFADVLYHRWAVVMSSGVSIRRTLMFGLPLLALEGALLALPRRPLGLTIAAAGALLCWGWLAFFGQDPIFSGVAFGLLGAAAVARYREPRLLH
ncbi:MAG: diacylglycerol kinase family protein [Myxococcota bacterium]